MIKNNNKQTEQYTPILLRTEAKEQVVRAWGDGDASRSGVDMQRLCRWSTPYLYDTQLCPSLNKYNFATPHLFSVCALRLSASIGTVLAQCTVYTTSPCNSWDNREKYELTSRKCLSTSSKNIRQLKADTWNWKLNAQRSMLVNPVFLLIWVESIDKSSPALKRTQTWEEKYDKNEELN